MAIYMRISGIDGNVTTNGYINWIELETIDFGVQRKIQMQVGQRSDRI